MLVKIMVRHNSKQKNHSITKKKKRKQYVGFIGISILLNEYDGEACRMSRKFYKKQMAKQKTKMYPPNISDSPLELENHSFQKEPLQEDDILFGMSPEEIAQMDRDVQEYIKD